ncbi:hypothetical protein GGI35DRAFT_93829 [Trichoderma velutinum]
MGSFYLLQSVQLTITMVRIVQCELCFRWTPLGRLWPESSMLGTNYVVTGYKGRIETNCDCSGVTIMSCHDCHFEHLGRQPCLLA